MPRGGERIRVRPRLRSVSVRRLLTSIWADGHAQRERVLSRRSPVGVVVFDVRLAVPAVP